MPCGTVRDVRHAQDERLARSIAWCYARYLLRRRVQRVRAAAGDWITARPQPADYLLRAVMSVAGCVTLAVLIWLSDR